jgi:hypothetical protein
LLDAYDVLELLVELVLVVGELRVVSDSLFELAKGGFVVFRVHLEK